VLGHYLLGRRHESTKAIIEHAAQEDVAFVARRSGNRAMGDFAIFDSFADNPVVFEDDELSAVGLSAAEEFRVNSGTVFVAVGSGKLWLNNYLVGTGMYACAPAPAVVIARHCRALLATVKHYRGIFMVGGPLESGGRLRYINGCTDTGLIQPLRCGDPCLNYLHFPAAIRQDAHHHPSHRIGLVYSGQGLCHSDKTTPLGGSTDRITAMRTGGIFVIPAGTRHWFETSDETLRIVAFHPDSEWGPTDESHQMLNATLQAEG
jgi:mannose-6-phosphate isomerase-like protein (cupin superfamily)